MKSAMIAFSYYVLLCLLLNGCYRGCACPDYCLPEEYTENCQQTEKDEELVNLGDWWKQFDDSLLDHLIAKSFECNYDVRIAREKVVEARAIYRISNAKLFPEVDLNTAIDRSRISQNVFDARAFGPAWQTLYIFSFDSTWELDFFGKNYYTRQADCLDAVAAAENVRDVNITAIGDIARNYATIRGIQERIKVVNNAIKSEENLYELTLARYQAGLTTQADPDQAKALLYARKSDLPLLTTDLHQTIYSLSILVGVFPEDLLELLCPVQSIPNGRGKIPIGLPSDLLWRRGDVRRAELQWQAAGFRVASAKADLFPTFSLTTALDYESVVSNLLFKPSSRTFTVMPSMFWPIFDAGRRCANVQAENSRARQALFSYEKSIVNALKDVESALIAYCQEFDRLDALEQEVQSYKNAKEILQERYTGGLVSFTDVLEVERLLFNAEEELVISKQNIMVYLIAIYKALGGGWECCCMP